MNQNKKELTPAQGSNKKMWIIVGAILLVVCVIFGVMQFKGVGDAINKQLQTEEISSITLQKEDEPAQTLDETQVAQVVEWYNSRQKIDQLADKDEALATAAMTIQMTEGSELKIYDRGAGEGRLQVQVQGGMIDLAFWVQQQDLWQMMQKQ